MTQSLAPASEFVHEAGAPRSNRLIDTNVPSLAKIAAEALQLSAEEKVRLADHLLASVSGEPDIEYSWTEEVERRLAEVEAGAPLVPLEDAVAHARRAIP